MLPKSTKQFSWSWAVISWLEPRLRSATVAIIETVQDTLRLKREDNQLGIEREGQRSFELGDDRIVEYRIGYARMRLNGDQTIVLVVFGPEGLAPLLGAMALEHLSLAVDPIHQRLVPVLCVAEMRLRAVPRRYQHRAKEAAETGGQRPQSSAGGYGSGLGHPQLSARGPVGHWDLRRGNSAD